MASSLEDLQEETTDIAIIGISGRFPGATSVQEFWHNIQSGSESVTVLSDEQLRAAQVGPDLFNHPRYVRSKPLLEDIELFDAGFFGYSPREAEIMDPQHRFFLECAWEVMENAGYTADTFAGAIGVYAGAGMNSYLLFNLGTNRDFIESVGTAQTVFANDKDYLATRVSYKLNLKGPSLTVQTACSTSLVAVHLACQSLLHAECDLALAGGVSINVPQQAGYLHEEGGILSPDGHCRAFDASAQGTVPGSGVGVVLLKRLDDALADGDTIHAVIKGSAINNDGALKAGYTAPSVDGQAQVITEALAMAEVNPETIGYVEAHGTGTPLGDPIEVLALTKAFRASTQRQGFCALGSVKTNIGHLDAAAGVVGLIKTVLALTHRQLPPSLHFTQPNPQIDFAASPFYVNTDLRSWSTPAPGVPRRAGVSSFGIGGTNAHVILEEAPPVPVPAPITDRPQLLVLSARSEAALDTATAQLQAALAAQPDLALTDVAWTLQQGRTPLAYRRALVVHDHTDAVAALATPSRWTTAYQDGSAPRVAFLLPGQGAALGTL
ncbi:MAG: polyketide synthase, partial [Chloroflexi bacterium]|nr:polyketide synthase [Chloroflexota bacterium]